MRGSEYSLERILKLKKRTARIILNADFTTPSKDMFEFLKWMPIHKLLLYNKENLTYNAFFYLFCLFLQYLKRVNGLTHEYITNMLTPNSQAHGRTLRSPVDDTLAVPRSRTSLYDKAFSVSAPKILEFTSYFIKNAPSLSSFQTN